MVKKLQTVFLVLAMVLFSAGSVLGQSILITQDFEDARIFPEGTMVPVKDSGEFIGDKTSEIGAWQTNSAMLVPVIVANPDEEAGGYVAMVTRTGFEGSIGPMTALMGFRDDASITSGMFEVTYSIYFASGAAVLFRLADFVANPTPFDVFIDGRGTLRTIDYNCAAWQEENFIVPKEIWVDFRVVADIDNASMSLYINDGSGEKEIFSGRGINKDKIPEINTITFLPQPPNWGLIYVDNVVIKQL
jgi:hypothetical protein